MLVSHSHGFRGPVISQAIHSSVSCTLGTVFVLMAIGSGISLHHGCFARDHRRRGNLRCGGGLLQPGYRRAAKRVAGVKINIQ